MAGRPVISGKGSMIRKIDLGEFHRKYSFNERREHLYGLFTEELDRIKPQCVQLRVLVFGSYITTKREPRDIDVLIALVPAGDWVYTLMTRGLQRWHPGEIDVAYHKTQYCVMDAERLVRYFNENPLNRKKDIRIKRAVEITGF